jgi:pimeloyl-ACP methyl ester carboxylesterase
MTLKTVDLPQGPVRYRDEGDGPPVVFVHGVLVTGELWRKVVPPVADAGFRCLVPDLPLGAHSLPMAADADLTPIGQAKIIADFLEALDVSGALIVANDTGGAITQLLMTRHPERVGGVVFTPSDCFDQFFPPLFRYLTWFAKVPGGVWQLVQPLRFKAFARLPIAFGLVSHRPIPDDVVKGYFRPALTDRLIRRDLRKFLRSVDTQLTIDAAKKFPGFRKPVLLAWAADDRIFPVALAHRLAELLPDAKVVEIADSLTFVPEDQPDELAKQVIAFARVMAD